MLSSLFLSDLLSMFWSNLMEEDGSTRMISEAMTRRLTCPGIRYPQTVATALLKLDFKANNVIMSKYLKG